MRVLIVLLLFPLFIPHQSLAIELSADEVLLDCVPTPIVDNKNYPGAKNIIHNNNLRRKTGIALVAMGEPIYITGKVVDEDCIPVDGVEVEIWHANAYGKYQAGPQQGEDMDENFLGSGYAKTDNLGRFGFLSIFPGAADKKSAPKIHFKVKRKGFTTLDTVMYFPEEDSNSSDETLGNMLEYKEFLTASHKIKIKDGKIGVEIPDQDAVYNYNITLKGKYRQKHY